MSDEDLAMINAKGQGMLTGGGGGGGTNARKKRKQQQPTKAVVSAGAKLSTDAHFVFPVIKSQSRPNILDYDDPWVRQGEEGEKRAKNKSTSGGSNKPKLALSRGTKSLQSKVSTEEVLLDRGKDFLNPSSSVVVTSSVGDVRRSGSGQGAMNRSRDSLAASSTTLSTLQVNLQQPRHSFSSVPLGQRTGEDDDELQLSIRRLSEQTRYSGKRSSPIMLGFNSGSSGAWTGTPTAAAAMGFAAQSSGKARPKLDDQRQTTVDDVPLETTC